MTRPSIRYIKPVVPQPEEWIPYLRGSYAEGYFANFGPAVRAFEERIRQRYARGRAVVSSTSATAGLTCALQALGVRGRVLLPAYTFPATAQAVLMARCEPVFCEVSEETWELAPAAVASLLESGDIRAIVHVRAYGFGHDLAWLEELARSRNIPLVIDAAAALGAEPSIAGCVGQQGVVEVFSLHVTKVFGIGEGALAFMNPELEQRYRGAANFGIREGDVVSPGMNGKMSDFQAAVGLAVLNRIDGFVRRRREVAARYHRVLSAERWIRQAPDPGLSPWYCYPVRMDEENRVRRVLNKAAAAGLELKRGYYLPLHRTTVFSGPAGELPVSDALGAQVVCLPVHADMEEDTVTRVLEIVMDAAA